MASLVVDSVVTLNYNNPWEPMGVHNIFSLAMTSEKITVLPLNTKTKRKNSLDTDLVNVNRHCRDS